MRRARTIHTSTDPKNTNPATTSNPDSCLLPKPSSCCPSPSAPVVWLSVGLAVGAEVGTAVGAGEGGGVGLAVGGTKAPVAEEEKGGKKGGASKPKEVDNSEWFERRLLKPLPDFGSCYFCLSLSVCVSLSLSLSVSLSLPLSLLAWVALAHTFVPPLLFLPSLPLQAAPN